MSGLKTSRVSLTTRLHRIHANPAATRVEFPDLGGQTWRGEGGDNAAKASVAYRLALCWNVLEGMPSERLASGWLRDLLEAVQTGDIERAQKLVRDWCASADTEHGRLHDCESCLKARATEAA